jgi:hypothetical protein
MRNILGLVCSFLLFTSLQCRKENNCHSAVTIINHSNQGIIPAIRIMDVYHNCQLTGSMIHPGESYEYDKRECWESILKNGSNFEIYMVDTMKYNDPYVFYNCDSIEIKNKVLKHYVLSLSELQNMDFVVNYN